MKLAIIFCVFLVLLGSGIEANEHVYVYKHRSVNRTFGPDDAVYCQLVDPNGHIAYDGFGRCNLVIERVSMDHRGIWTMSIGLPGRIQLVEQSLNVYITEEEYKPTVNTSVTRIEPEVIVTCTVRSFSPITACKFRDANGRILIADNGISEDRFVSFRHTDGGDYPPYTTECGFRIINPLISDLGLWRCAMESAEETYYGHLNVLCPWLAAQRPELVAQVITDFADVLSEPVLTAERTAISVQEGDSVTMSCHIQAPIRYCYFRRQNGTIFNVSPAKGASLETSYARTVNGEDGASSLQRAHHHQIAEELYRGRSTPTMEYVGAGFESGECGIRFPSLLPIDGGTWNCAVGLYNDTAVEQRASFAVTVNPLISVRFFYDFFGRLTLYANVTAEGRLEYCRFIRMDGVGFTSMNVPDGFWFSGRHEDKTCTLIIENPTIINLHPWTIAAKIIGRDEEIVRTTTENLLRFPSDDVNSEYSTSWYLWLLIAVMVVALVLVITACGPKKNRQWTCTRATIIRNSVRNSLRKEPLPPQAPFTPNNPTQNQGQNV